MITILRRLRLLLTILFAVLVLGTAGFMLFDHLSLFDAVYLTVVTVATVGYGDIHPESLAGRVFAIGLIIVGVGAFTAVVVNAAGFLIDRRQDQLRHDRLNTLIALFYSEVGNRLLEMFSAADPERDVIRRELLSAHGWSDADVASLRQQFEKHKYLIVRAPTVLPQMKELLGGNGDMLLRFLENPGLDEHEPFTDLLQATFHLRDELALRGDFAALPDTDIAHLTVDAQRCYGLLARRWLVHMHRLKTQYPYLFSLALRTNPFNEDRSPIVR